MSERSAPIRAVIAIERVGSQRPWRWTVTHFSHPYRCRKRVLLGGPIVVHRGLRVSRRGPTPVGMAVPMFGVPGELRTTVVTSATAVSSSALPIIPRTPRTGNPSPSASDPAIRTDHDLRVLPVQLNERFAALNRLYEEIARISVNDALRLSKAADDGIDR